MRSAADQRERGFTLIESLAAIVVVAVALTGVLLVLNLNIRHSADPMIETQAYDIAGAYLDEIMPKAYGACQTSTAPANRPNWEHVECYNGLDDSGAHDQTNSAVAGLGSYRVRVTVANATLCRSGGSPCPPAELVTVRVTHAPQVDVNLSAYRLGY